MTKIPSKVPAEWLLVKRARFFFWPGKKTHGFEIELEHGDGKGWNDKFLCEDLCFSQLQDESSYISALLAHGYSDSECMVSWYYASLGVHNHVNNFRSTFVKTGQGEIMINVSGNVAMDEISFEPFSFEISARIEFV